MLLPGGGIVTTLSPKGRLLVGVGGGEDGGAIQLQNKTNEDVIQMLADEYGNGFLGVFDRKGMGRVIRPGP